MSWSAFSAAELARIGVHTCPGGDQDSTHSLDVDYALLLPRLLQLKAGVFYVQLASEPEPEKALAVLAEHLPDRARVFIGVTDPIDPRVETPEQVRDRVLAAARHLPPRPPGHQRRLRLLALRRRHLHLPRDRLRQDPRPDRGHSPGRRHAFARSVKRSPEACQSQGLAR
ncbi:hypothetical protein GCM10020000_07810 [Streptomyces olivoverticillatus]